jgi:hypothetical protein
VYFKHEFCNIVSDIVLPYNSISIEEATWILDVKRKANIKNEQCREV